MPADWYCEINGIEHGPLTSGQLRQLAVQKKLQPTDMVWKEGMPVRVPASTVKGLIGGPPPPAKKKDDLVEFEMVAEDEEELVEFEMIAEVVEEETEARPRPAVKKPEKKKKEDVEVLAEATVTYRSGLPDVKGPVEAEFSVEAQGIRFNFDEEEFFVAFEKIESVSEPMKGDFPAAMKKKAMAAKVGSVAGKLATGIMGRLIGGDAGSLVEKVGGEAANAASSGGDLGPPPRNRLTVVARLRKDRCKVLFDVNGDSREEMSEEARAVYRKLEKARKKASEVVTAVEEVEEVVDVVEEAPMEIKAPPASKAASPGGVAPSAGKPFRVMSGGRPWGPYSLQEIRAMLSSRKISGSDMIGFETWVPVATLIGLLGAGMAASQNTTAEDYGDYEEVVEETAPKKSAEVPKGVGGSVKADDGEALPVDEEFKI